MGCSNSVDVIANSEAEAERGSGKVTLEYFNAHGRAAHIYLALCYAGVDFEHCAVSIPGGFIKRKVCGPLKYGTLPKLKTESGTLLHQSESLLRYVGARWKGKEGECLYPAAD